MPSDAAGKKISQGVKGSLGYEGFKNTMGKIFGSDNEDDDEEEKKKKKKAAPSAQQLSDVSGY